jgi:hypothetical protein
MGTMEQWNNLKSKMKLYLDYIIIFYIIFILTTLWLYDKYFNNKQRK